MVDFCCEREFQKIRSKKIAENHSCDDSQQFLYNTFRSVPESIVWEGCSLEVAAHLFFIRTEQMEPCGLVLHAKTVVCVYFGASSVKVISSKSNRN